ncbi:hypothetical protein CPB97_004928, partial [Podila verticillata]
SDTDTLREAHERQKRISEQRLLEQKSTLGPDHGSSSLSKPVATAMPLKGPPKPSPIARSTSASAIPSRVQQHQHSQPSEPQKQQQHQPGLICNQRSAVEDDHSGPVSPFLAMLDKHPTSTTTPNGSHIGTPNFQLPVTQPPLINSANQSPAFLAKRLYDSEHRMPWLALPGSASGLGGSASGDSSPSLFVGRRRSDVGVGGGGMPTTTGGAPGNSDGSGHALLPQQEHNSTNPRTPLTTPQHHHHQHLLSQQEIVNLGRHGSPMPLNEALPHYLRAGQRQKSADNFHSNSNNASSNALSTAAMERSFSSPNAGVIHTTPVSPFMIPMSPSLSAAAGLAAVANTSGGGHTPTLRSTTGSGINSLAGSGTSTPALVGPSSYHHASPSHMLFAFPGSHNPRPEMERGSGSLPVVNRSGWLDPHAYGYSASGSTTPLGPSTGAAMGTGLGSVGVRLHSSSSGASSNSKEMHA